MLHIVLLRKVSLLCCENGSMLTVSFRDFTPLFTTTLHYQSLLGLSLIFSLKISLIRLMPMMSPPTEWYQNNYLISTNSSLIQPAAVNAALGSDLVYVCACVPVHLLAFRGDIFGRRIWLGRHDLQIFPSPRTSQEA